MSTVTPHRSCVMEDRPLTRSYKERASAPFVTRHNKEGKHMPEEVPTARSSPRAHP